MKIEMRKSGEQVALILPNELVSQLDWAPGDAFNGEMIESALRVVRTETKHDRAMKIAKKGMKRYRKTLDTLAKI